MLGDRTKTIKYDRVPMGESELRSASPPTFAGGGGGGIGRRKLAVLFTVAVGAVLALLRLLRTYAGCEGGGLSLYDSSSVAWPSPNGTSSSLPWPAHIRPSTSYKFYYPVDPGGVDHRWPRVAWVMSFPNSGTSYTMRLIQRASNRTGGSNYGKECDVDPKTGDNYPVYDDSPRGPFLSQPRSMKPPGRYVAVKTHCGGYNTESGPDKYAQTVRSFQEKCLTGNVIHPERDPKTGKIVSARGKPNSMVDKEVTLYDSSLVQRAVHIIRDPFDNIVSRFHLEQHAHDKRGEEEWVAKFPGSPEGFKAWCKDLDGRYEKEERKSRFVDPELREQFGRVPCHAEFHRYAQWHNLAVAVARRMRIPSHVLHYERYETDFVGTYNDLFFFLELPREGEVPEFIPGKSYEEYFTKEERREGMRLVQMVAEPETWELLERYDRHRGNATAVVP